VSTTPLPWVEAAQQQTQAPVSGSLPWEEAAQQQAPPDTSGTTTNDSGSTVIIPRAGESFDETMRRAAAFGQTAEAKSQAQKESTPQNLGTKAAETLAAAPAIGAAGTAALAGVGEAGAAAGEATLKNLPAVTKLVQAAGELAKDHPYVARGIYDLIRGSLLVKIIRSWPE
jgi:hypothetical protein